MTPDHVTVETPIIPADGGLIPFHHANLRADPHNAARQESMAPANRQDKPSNMPGLGASAARPSFFLRTKLLPPRPAPELLPRPRLTDRLLANLSSPLTLVTANAGSGKTTLVADFLRTHKRQFVWYQLDHTDADPSVFLGYLGFGIQQLVPGFGEAMFAYIDGLSAESTEGYAQAQSAEAAPVEVTLRRPPPCERTHARTSGVYRTLPLTTRTPHVPVTSCRTGLPDPRARSGHRHPHHRLQRRHGAQSRRH